MEKINYELSKELNKNNENEKGIFFDKFKDANIDDKFYDYQNEMYFYFSILIQVVLTYVFIYSAIMYCDLSAKIAVLSLVAVETVMFIVILDKPNLDKKYKLSIVKFYITLINSMVLLISITINLESSNYNIFIFTLLALLGIVCINLNFTIKNYSLFTNFVTFAVFLIMMLINVLTAYELNFVNIETLNSFSTDITCNSLRKYEDADQHMEFREKIKNTFAMHTIKILSIENNIVKNMTSNEINKFDEYMQLKTNFNNFTEFSEKVKSLNRKVEIYDNVFKEYTTMDEFTYLYYLRIVSNNTLYNFLELNKTSHKPFTVYLRLLRNTELDFKDMFDNFMEPLTIKKIKSYGLNYDLCKCVGYILNKNNNLYLSFNLLIDTGKYFISKNRQLNTKLTLISAALFFILFIMLNYFFPKSQKESFISNIRYKIMYYYYENFIKGMKSKIITLNNDRILFINNDMYEFLKEYKLSETGIENNNYNNAMDLLNLQIFEPNIDNSEAKEIYDKTKEFMNKSKKYNHFNEDYKNEISLYDEFLNLLNSKEQSESFINLGQFRYFEEQSTFYNVFYRLVKNDNYFFIDFIFDDITEIIKAHEQLTANKEKEKVMAKVAHEFKTPLIIIKNNVNELRNDMTKKESKEIIDKIINISDYVSFLINDIINESNKNTLKIEKSVFKIKDILNFCYNIAKSLASSVGNPNVKIEIQYEELCNNIKVISDPIRLKQVFLNLLSNAIKFTKFGKILINAKLINVKDDNYNMMISIEDTGTGIRPNDLELLRNVLSNKSDIPLVFKQEGKINSMGTGLGIGICKLILDKLEYPIEVNSEYGTGTKFIITINNSFLSNSSKNSIIASPERKNINYDKESYPKRHSLLISENEENINENFNNVEELSETKYIENEIIFNNFDKEELKNFATSKIEKYIMSNNLENLHTGIITEVQNQENICKLIFIQIDDNDENIVNDRSSHHNVPANPNKNIIVVVDDSNEMKKSVINILNSDSRFDNFEILPASDGTELVYLVTQDQYNGNRIKLVLSDEEMNFLNGSDAIKILKNMESNYRIKPIKYISLTSHESSQYERLYQIGFDKIITKPLRKDNLKIIFETLQL